MGPAGAGHYSALRHCLFRVGLVPQTGLHQVVKVKAAFRRGPVTTCCAGQKVEGTAAQLGQGMLQPVTMQVFLKREQGAQVVLNRSGRTSKREHGSEISWCAADQPPRSE